MATFSINLSDQLAKASREAAKRLDLTRAEFIRQAIVHELKMLQKKFEQEAMVKSIEAMKISSNYLAESEEIEVGLSTVLPTDEVEWWKK